MSKWLLSIVATVVIAAIGTRCQECELCSRLQAIPVDPVADANLFHKRWYLIKGTPNAYTESLPGGCGIFDVNENKCKCTIFDPVDGFLVEYSFNNEEHRINSHIFIGIHMIQRLEAFCYNYDYRAPRNVTLADFATDKYNTYIMSAACTGTSYNSTGAVLVFATSPQPSEQTQQAIQQVITDNNITGLVEVDHSYCSYPASTYTTSTTQFFAG